MVRTVTSWLSDLEYYKTPLFTYKPTFHSSGYPYQICLAFQMQTISLWFWYHQAAMTDVLPNIYTNLLWE